ncbi:FkbM family methyltransferase [Thermomonas sp.]|uniref:FkbM family methyltransferase n=1 Tax=Thermomonas sp. TaxID=1971895 RepID=UPI001AC51414|nr:FkbM family methyltransferase [Xanthomonadales bacterium]MBN8794107.1 FkbM family methyltransferase [Stenotrophomonas nitritireducens]
MESQRKMESQRIGTVEVRKTSWPRRLAEIVLGPWVVQRRLPVSSGAGRIVVSGRVGGLKFLLKPASRWDMSLLNVARAMVRRGNVVWDIGANLGLFARAAAFHAGAEGFVLAVEADADAVALLRRTAVLVEPDHARIAVLPVAVADTCGVVQFDIAARARAANAIRGFGSTQTGGVRETRLLPSLPLDALLSHFPAPDVVKIDVEGAEIGVLAGARRLLTACRPMVYCEVQDYTRRQAVQLLEDGGYTVFDGDRFAVQGALLPVNDRTSNVIALPRDAESGDAG